MTTQRDVAEVAEASAFARQAGARTFPVGQTVIDLNEPDYCARKVRQWHEAAMGLAPWRWEFSSPDALTMEENLRLARHEVREPQRGDIVFFNRNSGKYGHVGIWLGGGQVAEGTSASNRGNPRKAGTKISRVSEIGAWRMTSCCRPLPAAVEPLKLILQRGDDYALLENEVRNGRMWVPVDELERTGVVRVNREHIGAQRKVYIID